MKNSTTNTLCGVAALALLTSVSCGDDTAKIDAGKNIDASHIDGAPAPAVFTQVEQLARPGINEVFLFDNALMNGYNATAPTFNGAGSAAVSAVTAEAKTVMEALYLGACFIDAEAGLGSATSAAPELAPAGQPCPRNPAGNITLFQPDGVTLTPNAGSAAQAYADLVFSQFELDVMRIDTTVPSSYFSLCGTPAAGVPLLCGGRYLTDDVIDITYDYLLGGAAVPLNGGQATGLDGLKQHLVSDGVAFSTTVNDLSALAADPANSQQGHTAVLQSFPYSAPPF